MYLCSEQGLVKTKAYLILSYIINEEENDVINATHDHLNYIIGKTMFCRLWMVSIDCVQKT